MIGFFWPIIIIKKAGKNPHGTHEGSSLLTRLSSVSIFLWLGLIISYIFFDRVITNLLRFNFLSGNISIIIGMIIVILGFLFELLGTIALGINFRIELPTDETQLITSGIYKIMRNPIVFGVFLLIFGSFLIIPTLVSLLIYLFNILTFNSKAIDEEKFLLRRFGKEYKRYLDKVGRYLPFKIKRK